jgi:hypothetical protein
MMGTRNGFVRSSDGDLVQPSVTLRSVTTPIVPGPAEPTELPTATPEPTPSTTRPRWVIPAIIALAVLLLAGATAAIMSATRTGAPVAAPTAATSAAASPTGKTATIGQYAGLVNGSISDMRDSWRDYDGRCMLVDPKSGFCALTALTIETEAYTLTLKLSGAAKQGVPAYIGAPPAEVERLVADTLTAAQRVRDVLHDEDPKTVDDVGLLHAMGALLEMFNRWQPYL